MREMFKFLFGDANQKYIDSRLKIVEKINQLEPNFEKKQDNEFPDFSQQLKQKLKDSQSLDDILPQAFGAVREAAKRTLKQRHFDVQLLGGIVLHEGKIAEMMTGEGKTLAATLPAYLNALTGKGVHVVTVNDYLAQRDAVWMGQIYDFLGLKVACLIHEKAFIYDKNWINKEKEQILDKERDQLGSFKVEKDYLRPVSRQEAYQADIVYGTNNEFGFDYLRDNMVYDLNQRVQRGHYFAIVDEIDSILIDEARTPLIIVQPDTQSSEWYKRFAWIVRQLEENKDYEVDEKFHSVNITPEGIAKVEKILNINNLYAPENFSLVHYLDESLKAKALFHKDKEYVVKDGEVVIVDEFTGRLMHGRRFSGGLHQALEAKENVEVKAESKVLGTITYQNYFRLYKKLAGMTGTAQPSAEEFHKVYGLDVVSVPTNKPLIRKDLPDAVYLTKQGKFKALISRILEAYKLGQPVLIGTRSIEMNEYISKLLKKLGIHFEVLNAKNHEREGEIIAQAGRLKSITVATNMAGRGVDIILGGNPPDPEEAKKVKELGGLLVIGTERHEARRIDDQLRGRAGRQGDPGITQFYLSLEDDLLRVFGGDRIKRMMETLNMPEDQPIESKIVSKAVLEAQKKIEGFNFDARKRTLEFDEVLQKQRDAFYKYRLEVLEAEQKRTILNKAKEIIKNLSSKMALMPKEQIIANLENLQILNNDSKNFLEEKINLSQNNQNPDILTPELEKIILSAFENKIENLTKNVPKEDKQRVISGVLKTLFLQILDFLWTQHLEDMEALRESVNIRAWGQRDPLVEYKTESLKLWKGFFDNFESFFIQNFFLGLKA